MTQSHRQHSHLFVRHLTVLDNSLLDGEHGLVGESWIVDLELSGPLDDAGMVLDFGEVKRHIKHRLDAMADHRLIVPAKAAWVKIGGTTAQPSLEITLKNGSKILHESPAEALCLLDTDTVSIDAMTKHAQKVVLELLVELGLSALTPGIQLRAEQIDGAYYHYSHGLKKHAGNCQRIAHGHRSQVQVFVDNQRNSEEEAWITQAWNRRYLGTAEDLKETSEENGVRYNHFAHRSQQGSFALTLPEAMCDLLPHDTTVELLASTLAARIQQRNPGQSVRVMAFEGVDKGAFGHG
jgi:6-pyruvoyl-tetrahydropterin synthase